MQVSIIDNSFMILLFSNIYSRSLNPSRRNSLNAQTPRRSKSSGRSPRGDDEDEYESKVKV